MQRLQLGPRSLRYAGGPSTRVFVLLGHPVAHSLSPVFQTAALRALDLDAVYLAVDLEAEHLPQALEALRQAAVAGRVGGANVTLPHKRAVLSHLQAMDETSRLAGAVNTLVPVRLLAPHQGMGWRGHNTDSAGLLQSLEEAGVSLAGVPVLVLGAGGMARAAVVAALGAGAASIRVLARRPERGRELLEAVGAVWPGKLPPCTHGPLDPAPADVFDAVAVLLQCTSLGLRAADPSPLSLRGAPPELFVFDAVYAPHPTALLREAQRTGLRHSDGLGMLLHQGARSLQLWTGLAPPLDVMRRSLGLS